MNSKFQLQSWLAADKKRMLIVTISIVVAVMLIIWLFGLRGSQRDLARAFNNLSKAESYHTVAELELSLPTRLRNQQRPIVGVISKVEGDVVYQENVPTLTGQMYMEAKGKGMVLFADGEVRILPDAVAFNLDNLPSLLNPSGSLAEKWTYVNAPVLQTNNKDDVKVAMMHMLEGMEYMGKDKIEENGSRLQHFRRAVTPEQEDILAEVFRENNSGNQGLHIITRLLRTFDVSALEVWVDPGTKSIAQVKTTFKKPSDQADEFRSILTLKFSDYDKDVVVDRPVGQLTVKPAVFANIFGGGEIEAIE